MLFLSIFDIITSGFLIGVLVSAPMGPTGMLCIQRALNKGQWHGFFSGVGAMLSDIFYAGITCLGMGFIIDYVEGHYQMLLVVGSVLMMVFGIYIFRSNPAKKLQKPKTTGNSFYTDVISTFLITLANPLIIFFYITLYARFNFIQPGEKWFSSLIGMASLAVGALSWWFFITFVTSKLRKVFNVRGLWILNMAVGTAIIVFSIWGLFTAFTQK